MRTRSLSLFALASLLVLSLGCNQSGETPPGGAQAVAYWHAVLQQYPDLPEKVRAIVEKPRQPDWLHSLPQQVRIYGVDEVVSVQGRHVNVVVTDLDDDTLRKLLAWWESVPRWASKLDVEATLPISIPESTRHIVVLGRQGRIQIAGPGGYDLQSINILSDDAAARTTIGVYAFGSEGQIALDQMAAQYSQVRGPPRSEVKAGRISLPPPEDNITVLVIGQLGTLDIEGPYDNAQQEISFAHFLNRHESLGQVAGVLGGTPFEAEYVADAQGSYADPGPEFVDPPSADFADDVPDAIAPVDTTPRGNIGETISPPSTILPGNNIQVQPPLHLPDYNYQPIRPPVVVTPPPVYVPPRVVVPRFGS